MSAGEICSREVVFVRPEESVRTAVTLMRSAHVGDVVVVEEQPGGRRPVGILTDRDVVVGLLAEDVDIDALTAGDVMSSDLITVPEEAEVAAAIELMREYGVRRLPVVDAGGFLAGILSVDDLIDFLAGQLTDIARLIAREQLREQRRRT